MIQPTNADTGVYQQLDLSRLNHGVHFRRIATVKLISDNFLQTFVVKLPPKMMAAGFQFPPMICPRNMTKPDQSHVLGCSTYTLFTDFLHDLHVDSVMKVSNLVDEMYELFEETTIKQTNTRSKKGLLNIIGELSSFFFGTISQGDLQKFQAMMTKLISDSSRSTELLNQEIIDMTAILRITNKRIDHAMAQLHEQNAMFHDFSVNMGRTMETMIKLTQVLFRKLYSATKLTSAMTEYLHSLERLSTGFLDPALITPSHLDQVLNNIQNHLQENFPQFHLITRSKAFYYTKTSSMTMRMDQKLIIFATFPLSSWHQNFIVYQVQTKKIPIPGDPHHATQITGLPNYLIVSEDHKHFFEMNQKPQIKNDLLQIDFQALQTSKNSCISALLGNNPILVSKQCQTLFLKNALTPQILQLTATSAALIQIPEYTLLLPNGTKQSFSGCPTWCIKTFACGSTFISESFVLPAKMADCMNTPDFEQTLFPTNLAIIFSMFNETQLSAFHSSLLLAEELSVQLPKIEFTNVSSRAYLEEDKQTLIDLDKLAQQLGTDQKLYDTQINAVNHAFLESLANLATFDTQNWKDWVLTINGILEIVLFISTIFIFWRLHKLKTLIIASLPITTGTPISPQQTLNPLIHPRLVNDQTNVLITNITAPVLGFQIDFSVHSKIFESILFISITCLLLCLIVKLYKKGRYAQYDWKTVICCNIANDKDMITLQMQHLPDDITNYTFFGSSIITNVQIIWAVQPKVILDWTMTIKHAHSTNSIAFKNFTPINWFQAWKLNIILSGTFYAIPFLRNGLGKTSPLTLEIVNLTQTPSFSHPHPDDIEMQIVTTNVTTRIYPIIHSDTPK